MNSIWLSRLGRFLIASLFIPAGIGKVLDFHGTTAYIAAVGLPLAALGAVIAIFVEIPVAAVFLLGYRTRLTAAILAVFTFAAAFSFHRFWSAPEAMAQMQQINFFKNMAITGGLLALIGLNSSDKTSQVS